ncbi:hypothetical protein ACU686_02280 [Yinghuangia aomiensis]
MPDLEFARPAGFVEVDDEQRDALLSLGIFHRSFLAGYADSADDGEIGDITRAAWLTGALLESPTTDAHEAVRLLYTGYHGSASRELPEIRRLPSGPCLVMARLVSYPAQDRALPIPATDVLQVEGFLPLAGLPYMAALSISTTVPADGPAFMRALSELLFSVRVVEK